MTRAEQILQAYRSLADLRVTEASTDDLVSVTVGPYGDLLAIELDPRVYRSRDADALARNILTTTRAAVDRAARDAAETAAALLPDHVDRSRADLAFDPALYELDRVIAAPAPRVPTEGRDLPVLEVDYRVLRRGLLALRGRLDAARGTATSDDGLITAVADGRGRLCGLTLHPRVLRTFDSRALARAITATVLATRRSAEGVW